MGVTALGLWLGMLFDGAPPGALIELRYRFTDGRPGMGQMFLPCEDARRLAWPRILAGGALGDLFAGVAPRCERHGGRDAIKHISVLWADCDGPDAVAALRRFRPRPGMVVRTGTNENCHAYWSLLNPVTPDVAERANRRLAHHLGADPRSTDAARILRPPGTFNHKHDPPVPVEAAYINVEVYRLDQVVGRLPDPTPAPAPRRPANRPRIADDDPLRHVPPAVYVEALTGRAVGRDGKVACPFHQDRTPSLHVYQDGWYCFGCDAGGSIIDFGAALYDLEPRGAGYREIRQRLERDLRRAA